ncbi:hypothetical protein [Nocardia sp. SSK8]
MSGIRAGTASPRTCAPTATASFHEVFAADVSDATAVIEAAAAG